VRTGVGLAVLVIGLAVVGSVAVQLRAKAEDSHSRLVSIRQTISAELTAGSADTSKSSEEPSKQSPEASENLAISGLSSACQQASELAADVGLPLDLANAITPLSEGFRALPHVGERSAAMISLAAGARSLIDGVQLACDALRPIVQADTQGRDISTAVAALAAQRDQLRLAADKLRTARGTLSQVDTRSLDGPLAGSVLNLAARLPAFAARLELAAELPELLGAEGPRTYLVLGQNKDELRPTGGFIGTAGTVTFVNGRVVARKYGSSALLSVPPDRQVQPPEPLSRYMGAAYWQLSEANWAPDFPTAALQARYFYNLVKDDHIAGVLAVDQNFVALLLEATGPIAVPEYGETVSASTVAERMDHYVHGDEAWLEDEYARKGFLAALFPLLLNRLNEPDPDRLPKLAKLLTGALTEQHLQVWLTDDRAQQALAELGWAGALLPTDSDYLYPVSANLGENKINREVNQELTYSVTADANGLLVSRVTLHISNVRPTLNPAPYRTADYRNYVRFIVPEGSELISADGFDDLSTTASSCGHTVMGGIVIVPPKQDRSVTIIYRLPPRVTQATYSLLVQKQPGAAPYQITVAAPFRPGAPALAELSSTRRFSFTQSGLTSTTAQTPAMQEQFHGPACDVSDAPPALLSSPVAVAIPKIGVQSDVVSLGVEPDGTLEAPKTGDVVGWYLQSARPGQAGNFVASGHLDWNRQPAVFWQLRSLQPGDQIQVVAADGQRYTYSVEWIRSVSAQTTDLDTILGPTTQRLLTLITCGGAFDSITRDYADRVIVRARLDPAHS
jgi:LPXTG-site transpeptidase (sortase) family protein